MRPSFTARNVIVGALCAIAFAVVALATPVSAQFAPATPEVVTPEPTREGVAPGTVLLVVWTSTGAPLPAGATACVGNLCQPIGGGPNGMKIEFERVEQGWNDISVTNASPFADAFSSVNVPPGQYRDVHLTLVQTAPAEEEPAATHASGPIRFPVTVAGGNDTSAWDESEPTAALVAELPATGAGDIDGAANVALIALGGTLVLATSAFLVYHRKRIA